MKKIGIILLGILGCWACSEDEHTPEVNISGVTQVESFTDVRDGHTYKCIQIGDQVWMAENLRYRLPQGALAGCYTYGEDYMTVDDVEIDRVKLLQMVNEAIADGRITDPPGVPVFQRPTILVPMYIEMGMSVQDVILYLSVYPDVTKLLQEFNDQLYEEAVIKEATIHYEAAAAVNDGYTEKYGYLYSYEGALKAVPEGWCLPTDKDWEKLEKYLGMKEGEADEFDMWRGKGTATFLKVNEKGIGFDVLYAGCNAYYPGAAMNYIRQNEGAYFWSSTLLSETDSTNVGIIRSLVVFDEGIMRMTTKLKGFRPVLYSVRCVRKEGN